MGLKITGDIIRDIVSQGLMIDGERLPEVQQYWYIMRDLASAVLNNDESSSSDTNDSTDGDSTSVDDLTSVSTPFSISSLSFS